MEAIAIVGIGCRFPGNASSPEAFWEMLCADRDVVGEVPPERLEGEAFADPHPGRPGPPPTWRGGFLEGVDKFDPSFFGITPREAAHMDPQQRVLLEVSWEALEDAGQVPSHLAGSRTGVFLGVGSNDYEILMQGANRHLDLHTLTGGARYAAAGRLAYSLGLRGPCLVVDTGASASLVAVHLACQSLRNGECTLALTGGANLILRPELSRVFASARLLASDGRCKFGDATADGIVRSEGVGVVVLKPLSAARATKDRIYAIIRGGATNHDGNTGGSFGTPGLQGQQELLREACRQSGVRPKEVHYVECHGTGTPSGDAVEIQALATVFGEGRPKDRPLVIGSVKTNLGHAEAAAGIAGLIKTVLGLRFRIIPASLHCRRLTPSIPWPDLPVVLQQVTGPWPTDERLALAGVSAFGLSGTNAHLILEGAPLAESGTTPAPFHPERAHLLVLSAHSVPTLLALARAYGEFMAADDDPVAPPLSGVCYTAAVRRTHHPFRLAVVGRNRRELAEQLAAQVKTGEPPRFPPRAPAVPRPRLALIFPGEGCQRPGMGQQLLGQEPVVRAVIDQCDELLHRHAKWSLRDELVASASRSRLNRTEFAQPALLALQLALAALWRSWGIVPDAVVGHGLGEVAAAHVAGALTLEQTIRVVFHRSRLLERAAAGGAIAVVELSPEETAKALSKYEDRLAIAARNSPRQSVLSGEPAALVEVLDRLRRAGVLGRLLAGSYAFHRRELKPVGRELIEILGNLQAQALVLPMYSTLTGQPCQPQDLNASYWGRQLCEPVCFAAAIDRLAEEGPWILIEVAPDPVLAAPVAHCLAARGCLHVVLPTLDQRVGECVCMLRSLGALFCLGYPVDFDGLFPDAETCASLPTYPWQRQRYWYNEVSVAPQQERTPGANGQRARQLVLACEPPRRREVLESLLCQEVVRVARLPASLLDVHCPLVHLGIDSLMSLELSTHLGALLGVHVPGRPLLEGISIAELAEQILARMMLSWLRRPALDPGSPLGGGEPCEILRV
jgi:acyl transferase domain-containing protein